MHTARTALDTLEKLWSNHRILCEKIDLDSMPIEELQRLKEQNIPDYDFRVGTWIARQGFFISTWSLWEYYARRICNPHDKQRPHESTVDWIGRSFTASGRIFDDQSWFASAACLRNLIAHSAARVEGARGEGLLERSRSAFPDLHTWKDGYVNLGSDHMAELYCKVWHFIVTSPTDRPENVQ